MPASNLRNIIALGGGGFSSEPNNLLLDEYILSFAKVKKPRVLFIPAAGGDHPEYVNKFYNAYRRLNCSASHLLLTRKKYSVEQLRSIVLSKDIIFVGGGSPSYLMNVWRKTGMIPIIRKAYKSGIILSGMSAGAICWFEDGFRNPKGDEFLRVLCMGFLEGSFCPHYDSSEYLRKAFKKMVSKKIIQPGYGVQDGVALHFQNEKLINIVSSNHHAKAFFVKRLAYRTVEKPLKAKYAAELLDKSKEHEIKTVKKFINIINRHDISSLLKMITEDHVFTDSLGIETSGKDNMEKAWTVYLSMFPDYKVHIEKIIPGDDRITLFGQASGTMAYNGKLLKENRFKIPASWTAVVSNDKIAQWRVYADNEPVRQIINKYK